MNTVNKLSLHFCPYGYLDLKAICDIGDQVEHCETEIFEIIDDFKESCGLTGYNDIDPVYCILEHILQQARNKIEEVLGYDFINDNTSGDTELAPIKQMENRFTQYFFNELGIDTRGGSKVTT